ncbi:superoxide dismutase [Sulfuricurvum sp.]|uniref:superoxide dismutase n=1 Tax=Sulfuricurvum sp. TaxID=2025608 RepID=UPI002625F7BE|nr:superoxide dismutase [Sulfuricurvum sp.]MDD2780070.1 superoxide dismutase [Sulfuricurvum sp.]
MKHVLMELPFEQSALAPYISAETLLYHYGKHHAGYVNKLNSLIVGSEYEEKSLEHIVKYSDGAIYNNAAQIYNHDFYWKGLKNGSTSPSVELLGLVERDFGSIKTFEETFLAAAAGFFGSGWVWLIITNQGKLEIKLTSNADTPIRHGDTPLLTCDVWEHAYYIDYRNGRVDYLSNWWKLINWNFVSANLSHFMNDPIAGYNQPCNDLNSLCEYVDFMQNNERTPS